VTPTVSLVSISAILGVVSFPASGSVRWLLPIIPLCVLALILGRMACLRLMLDDTGFEYRDILTRPALRAMEEDCGKSGVLVVLKYILHGNVKHARDSERNL
jgi:hypothetical protein